VEFSGWFERWGYKQICTRMNRLVHVSGGATLEMSGCERYTVTAIHRDIRYVVSPLPSQCRQCHNRLLDMQERARIRSIASLCVPPLLSG